MDAKSVFGLGVVAAFAAGCASGPPYQPHMQNALSSLENALSELQQSEPNKGGHRERAMRLVNDAINQVNLGIQFASGS